ncbi:MAG: MFS transporter [Gammaproteobacteria bacterium]|nr:MFS transporter [Gammaproteobacteria bacterium]
MTLRSLFSARRFPIMLLLGFFSGLPSALTASTLQAWFTDAGLSLVDIGAITLLALPYAIRFLWAPLFDRVSLPFLDRRRSWLWVLQLLLVLSIVSMAFLKPQTIFHVSQFSFHGLLLCGLITAILSTSQDIVINAWQTETFVDGERGLGAALYVTGWRIGMIVSGAVALIIAQYFNWKITYLSMAGLMLLGVIVTTLAPQSFSISSVSKASKNLLAPFQEFFQRYTWKMLAAIFFLLLTYKLGDALALAFNTTFLLREMHFDLATIGLVNKTISMTSALLGGIAAAIWMKRISLYRALFLFGIIQAFAHLGYMLLAIVGKNFFLLVFTAFLENFCSGMATIAFLALIMALCHVEYTATQFAFLSAMTFLGRIIAGPFAARLILFFGWIHFFVMCGVISLSVLCVLFATRKADVFSEGENNATTSTESTGSISGQPA